MPSLSGPTALLPALLLLLAAPALRAAETPELCADLALPELSALLGGAAEVAGSGPHAFDGVRNHACQYGALFAPQVFVNVNEDIGDKWPDGAAAAAREHVETYRLAEGEDYVMAPVDGLGEAALWDPQTQHLSVWLAGGNLQLLLWVDGFDDPHAAALEVAGLLVPALPAALP